MKKLGCLLIVFVLLNACTKDAVDELNNLLPLMSATIDGVEWTTSLRVTVEKDGQLIITGTSVTGESLIITIFGNTEGAYNLETLQTPEFSAVYKKTSEQSLTDASVSVSGIVNLLEVNTGTKTISGNFNFKMLEKNASTFEITNGEFSRLNYTVQ